MHQVDECAARPIHPDRCAERPRVGQFIVAAGCRGHKALGGASHAVRHTWHARTQTLSLTYR
jgi:hypothetical protein